jgi:hypothetical protein
MNTVKYSVRWVDREAVLMGTPEGEADRSPLRVGFDRRLKLEFQGSRIISDAGLLAYREPNDALGPTDIVAGVLMDNRTGKNGWHVERGTILVSPAEGISAPTRERQWERMLTDDEVRWFWQATSEDGYPFGMLPDVACDGAASG